MNDELRNMLMQLDMGRYNDIRAEIADLRDSLKSLWTLSTQQAIQPGVDDNGISRTTAGGIVLEQTINNANAQWVNWWLPITLASDNITVIYCQLIVTIGGKKYLYVGGVFTRIGGVLANNIARYNYETRQWEALPWGTGSNGVNGAVRVIAYNPVDGYLYIGGDFTDAGGLAYADYVAMTSLTVDDPGVTWEGVNSSGYQLNGIVRAIAFDSDGIPYVGGDFTNAGGDASADYVAKKPVSAQWTNVNGAAPSQVYDIAINSSDVIFICGATPEVGFIRQGSGGAWADYNSSGTDHYGYQIAFNNNGVLHVAAGSNVLVDNGDGTWTAYNTPAWAVYAIDFDSNNNPIVGGSFTEIDGVTAARAAWFNGVSWQPLTNAGGISGLGGVVYSIVADPATNTIYAAGDFDTAGTIKCACIAAFCRPLSDALDIMAGLFEQYDAYNASLLAAHTGNTSNPHNVTAAQVGALGYTLPLSCLPQPTTTDGQTVYWGNLPVVPNANSGYARVYIPKAGKIKAAYVFTRANTAGSAENWSMYIRVNSTTDYLIETEASSGNVRNFINTSLNSGAFISVNAGDYVEVKEVHPTWATNPADVLRSGVIYIEP